MFEIFLKFIAIFNLELLVIFLYFRGLAIKLHIAGKVIPIVFRAEIITALISSASLSLLL